MADSCDHICYPISPTHSPVCPREFTAEEVQERRDQHNCATSAPALASQNKIQQKEKREYHREESLAEADTKIKNLKKPLKIFCDILKVSKTKVKFSSLHICQTKQARRSKIRLFPSSTRFYPSVANFSPRSLFKSSSYAPSTVNDLYKLGKIPTQDYVPPV